MEDAPWMMPHIGNPTISFCSDDGCLVRLLQFVHVGIKQYEPRPRETDTETNTHHFGFKPGHGTRRWNIMHIGFVFPL